MQSLHKDLEKSLEIWFQNFCLKLKFSTYVKKKRPIDQVTRDLMAFILKSPFIGRLPMHMMMKQKRNINLLYLSLN
jgi:hypothetical protein